MGETFAVYYKKMNNEIYLTFPSLSLEVSVVDPMDQANADQVAIESHINIVLSKKEEIFQI